MTAIDVGVLLKPGTFHARVVAATEMSGGVGLAQCPNGRAVGRSRSGALRAPGPGQAMTSRTLTVSSPFTNKSRAVSRCVRQWDSAAAPSPERINCINRR